MQSLVLIFFLACGGEKSATPTPLPAAPTPVAATAPEPSDDCGCEDELEDLSVRVGKMEIVVNDIQQNGAYQADKVIYLPQRTSLSARTVQDALDEIAFKVQGMTPQQDLGAPSPVIFDPNHDAGGPIPASLRKQQQPQGGQPQGGQPQGGQGGQGGQSGGQNGGQNGGQGGQSGGQGGGR